MCLGTDYCINGYHQREPSAEPVCFLTIALGRRPRRGDAGAIRRMVWDHEVPSSSLGTPTRNTSSQAF